MPKIDLVKLTSGQRDFIQTLSNPDDKLVIWIGATGCGKTVGVAIGLIESMLRDYAMHGNYTQMLFAGVSTTTVRNNTLGLMRDLCDQYKIPFRPRGGSEPMYSFGKYGEAVIYGGRNQDRADAVMGLSTQYNWIDEATRVHGDVIDAIITRNRQDTDKTILSANAESPFNPLKLRYIDNPQPYQKYIESDFWDNPHYGDMQRETVLTSGLAKHNIARLTKNVWAPAEGLIFPIEEWMVRSDIPYSNFGVISYDEGISGITAALLFTGTDYGFHVIDEYWHDASNTLVPIEHHAEGILGRWQPARMLLDPTASAMKAELVKRGVAYYDADNRVEDGIQAVNNALHRRQLTIDSRCKHLLSELSGYAYNPKTGKPIKQNDHLADCLRYGTINLLPNERVRIYGR